MDPDDELSWNQQHHELVALLKAISGNAQLLQRQILRADNLVNVQRDMMLSTVASVLSSTQKLGTRIEALGDPELSE